MLLPNTTLSPLGAVLCVVTAFFSYLLYRLLYAPYQVHKRYGIRGPKPTPFWGSYWDIKRMQLINKLEDRMDDASKEFGITKPGDDVRVVIGQGGVIQHVMMPNQFRTVVAKGHCDGKWVDAVSDMLKQYGAIVKQDKKQSKKDCCLLVTFQNPSDAQRAVSECEYPEVNIQGHKPSGQPPLNFTLIIEWERRERKNFAYVTFDSPEEQTIAAPSLIGKKSIAGYTIQIKPDRKRPNALFIVGEGVLHLKKHQFEQYINKTLNGKVHFKFDLSYQKCESTDEQYQDCQRELMAIVGKYTNTKRCKVTLSKPEAYHVVFRAFVNFDSPEERERVFFSQLRSERLGLKPVRVMLFSKLQVRKEVFEVIKDKFQMCQTRLIEQCGDGLKIDIKVPNRENASFVAVRLEADTFEKFAVAHNALSNVAQPDIVKCKAQALEHYMCSSACYRYLEEIQAKSSTYICTDFCAMSVKIYGTKENSANARADVERHFSSLLDAKTELVELELGSMQRPPGLMKHLVVTFGKELERMLEIAGIISVTLNPRRQTITLLGTNEGYSAVKKCIEEYPSKPQSSLKQSEFEFSCCICLTQIECSEDLFRLECCGHAYHMECIELQVNPNTVTFPIQCASEECSKPFVWQDFENLKKRSSFAVETLITSSIRDYLKKNAENTRACPTPDCRMVYVTTDDGKPFICSHCGVFTCTECHMPYHIGGRCKSYKGMKERCTQEWMKNDSTPLQNVTEPTSDMASPTVPKGSTTMALLSQSMTTNEEVEMEIECLRRNIVTRRDECIAKHDEKIVSLRSCLEKLPSAKERLTSDEDDTVSSESEMIQSKIDECQGQRTEYIQYCSMQLELLSSISLTQKSLQSTIQRHRVDFDRECNRLLLALPIYAKRTNIVQTVVNNQVTILVGETGSGKSTQVVQYLYDAGVARNGLIVCTQPRKVAAITLAEHVSKEMNVTLGAEVGYQVGMSKNFSSSTKVIFMTDHTLLNECITDPQFSKYACVIIDEAHERSINTDLLLAFIKQCLPSCPELKVLIMSATIEPGLFVKYFKHDTTSVVTLMVPGRTYPVEVNYDPLMKNKEALDPQNDYMGNVVKLAKTIHHTEPRGDILVFLTSPPEIEKACQALEELNSEAEVLPLYGKLPPEEQQKVFRVNENKRKIVFSTNVAETSVTIPGVKYIIDTGLAREMRFDTKKNMDSLEVRLISKSSADQRKGRAGRTSAGKCFRLYTMQEFTSMMPERTMPEILRIQLSQVVLKLLEFGVSDVLTFNFVEQPDHDALQAAVDTLHFIGAIKDGVLTDLGKKMAVLPLNPQLAKVLLDGVHAGVGTEALASVALSSLAGQVFFRGGTTAMKSASEKGKLQFCHEMGDQMSSLVVYKCWLSQQKKNRNRWCVENYVNAKSMRMVEETMKELNYILLKQLHLKISFKLGSLEAAECYLPKLYFDAFLSNLAVYLGHDCVGYMTCDESSGTFLIFPGSSLKSLSCSPKYVLYEKTLKTSQQYLTQVMHVKEEWVAEAIRLGKLQVDPAQRCRAHMTELLDFFVGPSIYTQIKCSAKKIEDHMQTSCPQSPVTPVLDRSHTSEQWGVVRIFAPPSQHNALQQDIPQFINTLKAEMEAVSKEFGITKPEDDVRVVIGQGGVIQHVMMPNQFCTVVAKGHCNGKWVDAVSDMLKQYGAIVKQDKKQSKKDCCLLVTFQNPSDAQRAVSKCEYPEVNIYKHQPYQHSSAFTLIIEWERRERKNFAYITFDSPEEQAIAAPSLIGKKSIAGYTIQIKPDRKKPNALFVVGEGVLHFKKHQFEQYINQILNGRVHFKFDLGYQRCETTDEQYQDCQKQLMALIGKYTDTKQCKVTLHKPEVHHITYRTFVNFDSPEEREKVFFSQLRSEKIGLKSLHVMLLSKLQFRRKIFEVIKDNFQMCQTKLVEQCGDGLKIEVKVPNKGNKNFVAAELTADDTEQLTVAQNMLSRLAQPDIVELKTRAQQQYVCSAAFYKCLEEIQAKTSTYIYTDRNTLSVKIYGTKENSAMARAEVERKFIDLLAANIELLELELGSTQRPPGLMKHLVVTYGKELERMLEIEGVKSVTLNPRRQMITLLGTNEGFSAVKKCIEEYSSKPHSSLRQSEFEFSCCICFTQIESPEDLFRLECCGHAYHMECIELQVNPNIVTFPIQCASEECSKPFVWQDFENLKKRSNFAIEPLITSSLRDYMAKNAEKVRACPTPDCKMVYVATDDGKPFVCSHCDAATCTKCHAPYHNGVSCEFYQGMKKQDREVQEWMKKDPGNRKQCPQCAKPIEKNGGCNRVTCICEAHICWLCLKYFSTCGECYAHLQSNENKCELFT